MSSETLRHFQDIQNDYPDAYRLASDANRHFRAMKAAKAYVKRFGSDRSPNTSVTMVLVKKHNEEASRQEDLHEFYKNLATEHMPEAPSEK
ncbi:hypothetical protein KW803_01970 [Candidatus Saccharibacteria bacterium]|nr:hypothetical protein [Candidatus Saccharibacteria bacterium]